MPRRGGVASRENIHKPTSAHIESGAVGTVGRILFGLRDDLDLDQRWWHRLSKVAAVLSLIGVFLYFLSIPAFLPEGSGNIRVVETLADYTKSHPEIGDAVDGFTRLYRTHS